MENGFPFFRARGEPKRNSFFAGAYSNSGGFAGQSEQTGNKINCISIRLASETMETLVHLHAGILVIVKRADCHAMTVEQNAIHLCRLSGGNFTFYCFKYIQ